MTGATRGGSTTGTPQIDPVRYREAEQAGRNLVEHLELGALEGAQHAARARCCS